MRTLVTFAALLGAITVATKTKAQAQEKKQEEPAEFKTPGGTTYNERVTVKEWVPQQKQFLKPHAGVWALRKEIDTPQKKGLVFYLYGKTKPGADLAKQPGVFRVYPQPGSLITDASGNEYTVAEVEGDNVCWVKLTKAAPKKKP